MWGRNRVCLINIQSVRSVVIWDDPTSHLFFLALEMILLHVLIAHLFLSFFKKYVDYLPESLLESHLDSP